MCNRGVAFDKPKGACKDYDKGCRNPNKVCKMRGKLVKVVCVVDYNRKLNKSLE